MASTPGDVAKWALGNLNSPLWTQIVPSLNGQDITSLRNDPRITQLHTEYSQQMNTAKSRFDAPGKIEMPYNTFMDGLAQAVQFFQNKNNIKVHGGRLLEAITIADIQPDLQELRHFFTNEHQYHDPLQRILNRGHIITWREAQKKLFEVRARLIDQAESAPDYDTYQQYRLAHEIMETLIRCCQRI